MESKAKRPRATYLDLIDNYRKAAGKSWNDVDAASGVIPSTREQWFNGTTRNVPLIGIVRICAELGVPPMELFAAVLEAIDFEPATTRAEIRMGEIEDDLRSLRDLLQRLVDAQDDPPASGSGA